MSRPRNSESAFRAIADPTRRRMVDLLWHGERSVGELLTALRIRRSTGTFHLGVLIATGVVRQERRGRGVTCVLNSRALQLPRTWTAKYAQPRRD